MNTSNFSNPTYYGFKDATPEQLKEHAETTKYEGGFQYYVPQNSSTEVPDSLYMAMSVLDLPKSPLDEIKQYIVEELAIQMDKKVCDINICINMLPTQLFYELFPPTTPLPFGWKRYTTIGLTEKIKIEQNFKPISFLLGPHLFWERRRYFNDSVLIFRPHKGITISRTTRGKFTIQLQYLLFSANGDVVKQ